MFVLAKKSDPFWYTVNIPLVTETGTARSFPFKVQFKRFSRSKLLDLRQQSESASDQGDALENDTDYVMQIAQDWKDITGPDNAPLEFTRENVRDLLDAVPNAGGAIVAAFFEATLGGGAKKGN